MTDMHTGMPYTSNTLHEGIKLRHPAGFACVYECGAWWSTPPTEREIENHFCPTRPPRHTHPIDRPKATPPRADVLAEAITLITGDRNASYGEPADDFARTAAMWSAYLGTPVEAHDVAALLIMVKLSRISESPTKRDHWADIAGYAGCGYECTVQHGSQADH